MDSLLHMFFHQSNECSIKVIVIKYNSDETTFVLAECGVKCILVRYIYNIASHANNTSPFRGPNLAMPQ